MPFDGSRQPFHNLGIIDDAFLGNEKRGDATDVGFPFPGLLGRQPSQALKTIRGPALLQIFQESAFGFVRGDDQLPALVVPNAVFTAKPEHLLQSRDGEAGLCGSWTIIKAGMEDPAIVSGLVLTGGSFLLEEDDSEVRT